MTHELWLLTCHTKIYTPIFKSKLGNGKGVCSLTNNNKERRQIAATSQVNLIRIIYGFVEDK